MRMAQARVSLHTYSHIMCKILFVKFFCYNIDSIMDRKTSVIMRFKLTYLIFYWLFIAYFAIQGKIAFIYLFNVNQSISLYLLGAPL